MMKYLQLIKTNILLLIIFITGACVLVIEVAALRVLAPYFGNTIYSASSVIGIILGALSFGYYFGGKYADKHPDESRFYFLILLSGLFTFGIEILAQLVLPKVAYELSLQSGPLLMSLFLFTIPALLLGTLSPYVVKLQEKRFPKEGIGSLSGKIFFVSTFGSIAGSFLAGFYLIPYFGVSDVMTYTGAVLSVIGLLGVVASNQKKKIVSLVVATCLLFSFSLSVKGFNTYPNVIYSKDGLYERIVISDQTYLGRDARLLFLDRGSSSGIFLDDGSLAYDYTKYFELYKVFNEETTHALVIGGGAYTVPQKLIEQDDDVIVDVVEIEPELLPLSLEYFGVEDSPRIVNHVEDGRRFLHDTDTRYDLIFNDAFFAVASIPSHLTTKEFFELSKERLTDDGVFVANVIGQVSREEPNLLLSEMKTFMEVFENTYFFAIDDAGSLKRQNVIFVGAKSDREVDFSLPQLKNLIDGITLKEIHPERFDLANQIVFTDDFAPVERLSSKFIQTNANPYKEGTLGTETLSLIKQIESMGPRIQGSYAKTELLDVLFLEFDALDIKVEFQGWKEHDTKLTNVVGLYHPEKEKRILLGTHYDTYWNDGNGIPGANDSASGVASLIEIARALHTTKPELPYGIDFVFFDGEEGLESFGDGAWRPVGSEYFASQIGEDTYDEVIILDMVCDASLQIAKEKNSVASHPAGVERMWEIGKGISPRSFIDEVRYEIEDDSTSFMALGIPTMLLIDFDYPYFHTAEDSVSKCSAESLDIVGNTVLNYLKQKDL